jgi:hypothetical protein
MGDGRPGVNRGRWTASIDGDFVVFLIGARVERAHPLRSLRDLGEFKHGMRAMLAYLTEHPEKGLLGYQNAGLGTVVIQYWRSFAALEAFARDDDDPHLATWRGYWKRVGSSDRTGIWHETYLVRSGEYESIYGNMPAFGLGKATALVKIGAESQARSRLKKVAR